MTTLLDALLFAHVGGGAAALIAFWIPALSKKGSPLHRRAGRVYVRGMSVVLATSLPLSIVLFLRGNWLGGSFLLYLFVITATALYTGLRALKSKAGPRHLITPIYVVLTWATLVGGAIVLAVGVVTKTWLLAGFSLIGLTAGPSAIAFMRNPPTDSRYWWYEHFGGMIGTGIAAHVAFLNFGAQRLIPGFSLGDWGMLAWFTPVVIGIVASNRIEAHYRAKFAAQRADLCDRVGAERDVAFTVSLTVTRAQDDFALVLDDHGPAPAGDRSIIEDGVSCCCKSHTGILGIASQRQRPRDGC